MKRKSKYDRVINTTVKAAVADALAEFETLGEEMQDWYDGMPENLQSGSKGDDISAAADTLSGIDTSIEPPEEVEELPVRYEERQSKNSRAARCMYACNLLRNAIEAVETWKENNPEHEKIDDVETFIEEVTYTLDEAEGVEFPGMY